jgi:hypothetical protein
MLIFARDLPSGLKEVYGNMVDCASHTDEHFNEYTSFAGLNPNDWQGYSHVGLAYLQKARETDDPTDSQRTEQSSIKRWL